MLRSLVFTALAIHARALTPSTPCKRRRLQTRRPLVTEAVDLDACLSSDDALEPLYASTPEHGYARCPDCTAPVDVVSVDALLSARAFHPVWKSKFYGAFVLNRRVVSHAIDASPARWRGDAGSSPLD
jgi:hypothetical protein